MARLGRLDGALLLEMAGSWRLIGNLKRPCAFEGFEPPGDIDALENPVTPLVPTGGFRFQGPVLLLEDREGLAEDLARKLLVERNGSVSDRLWRLILSPGDPEGAPEGDMEVEAAWLGSIPLPLWDLIRDRVLRCV